MRKLVGIVVVVLALGGCDKKTNDAAPAAASSSGAPKPPASPSLFTPKAAEVGTKWKEKHTSSIEIDSPNGHIHTRELNVATFEVLSVNGNTITKAKVSVEAQEREFTVGKSKQDMKTALKGNTYVLSSSYGGTPDIETAKKTPATKDEIDAIQGGAYGIGSADWYVKTVPAHGLAEGDAAPELVSALQETLKRDFNRGKTEGLALKFRKVDGDSAVFDVTGRLDQDQLTFELKGELRVSTKTARFAALDLEATPTGHKGLFKITREITPL